MQPLHVSVCVHQPPGQSPLSSADGKLVLQAPVSSGRDSRSFLFHQLSIGDPSDPVKADKLHVELAEGVTEKVVQGLSSCLWVCSTGPDPSGLFSGTGSLIEAICVALFRRIGDRQKAMVTSDTSAFRVGVSLLELRGVNLIDLLDGGSPINANGFKTSFQPVVLPPDATQKFVTSPDQMQTLITQALGSHNPNPTAEGCPLVLLTATVRQVRQQGIPGSADVACKEVISHLSLLDVHFATFEDADAEALRCLVKELFDFKLTPSFAEPSEPTGPASPIQVGPLRTGNPSPKVKTAPIPSAFARANSLSSTLQSMGAGTASGAGTGSRPGTSSLNSRPSTSKKGKEGLKPLDPHSPAPSITFTPDAISTGPRFHATLLNSAMRHFLIGNTFCTLHLILYPGRSAYSDLLSMLQFATRFTGARSETVSSDEHPLPADESFRFFASSSNVPWTEPIPAAPPGQDSAPGFTEAAATQAAQAAVPAVVLPKTVNLEPPPWKSYKHPQYARLSWKRPIPLKNPTIKWVRNNTATIQATVNICAPGDVVIVQTGVYTEPLVLTQKGLLIKAEEGAHVVLRCNSSVPAVLFRTGYARVENITIQQEGNAEAVVFDKGSGELIGCDVSGMNGCVLVRNMCDPLIMNCRLHSSRRGFGVLLDHSRAIVDSNEIFGNHDSGIVVEKSSNPYIVGNKVHHGKGSGIAIIDNATGMITENDIYENACVGVLIQQNANPTLRENKIHHGVGVGISVTDNGRGVIEENDIFANAGQDMEIQKMSNPVVQKNHFHDGAGSGIAVWNNGRGEIIGNLFESYALAAVTIRELGNPLIKGNRILRGAPTEGDASSGVMVTDRGKGQIEENTLIGWQLEQSETGGGSIIVKTGGKPILSANRVMESEVEDRPAGHLSAPTAPADA
eukprot:RCo048109